MPGVTLTIILAAATAAAQTSAPEARRAPAPAVPAQARSLTPASPEALRSPQVVAVVHRLDGFKFLFWLQMNGSSIAAFDEQVLRAPVAHTSIVAGLAFDGDNIVVRLPQAEAEAQKIEVAPDIFDTVAAQYTGRGASPNESSNASVSSFRRAQDLMVVRRDGQRFPAQFVGLDGGTGLSLLRVEGLKAGPVRYAREEDLADGQRIRLIAPERADRVAGAPANLVYLRIGETEGRIKSITRTSTGQIARIVISAPRLSPTLAGGIAVSDAGEVIGIVDESDDREARVAPVRVVRRAIARVMARQGSVPYPWVGLRGETVARAPLEVFTSQGWAQAKALSLVNQRQGIILTTVAPGTPAAAAGLRPGDVITRAGGRDLHSVEDFTAVMSEANAATPLSFTVLRAQDAPRASFELTVKPEETLNPLRAMREAEMAARGFAANKYLSLGIMTMKLAARAAERLSLRDALLVMYVRQNSPAARADLRLGDIIESVNGRPLGDADLSAFLNGSTGDELSLGIIRNRQRMTVKLALRNEQSN